MLDKEARFFWCAAQRLRLSGDRTIQEAQDAIDDVVAVALHTDNSTLRARCAEIIEEGARCECSA